MTTLLSALLPSLAVVVSAIITTKGQRKIHAVVEDVQTQVTTINGKTIANYADEDHGKKP